MLGAYLCRCFTLATSFVAAGCMLPKAGAVRRAGTASEVGGVASAPSCSIAAPFWGADGVRRIMDQYCMSISVVTSMPWPANGQQQEQAASVNSGKAFAIAVWPMFLWHLKVRG